MAIVNRITQWRDDKSITAHSLNNEFDNLANSLLNVFSGTSPIPGSTFTSDINITGAGTGMIVKTPDGTKTYRIAIDNSGQLSTQEIT